MQNEQKISHLSNRIEQIGWEKINKIKRATSRKRAKTFRDERKKRNSMITEGKVKVKKALPNECYNVFHIFDFPKNWNKEFKTARRTLERESAKAIKETQKMMEQLHDEIILGDEKEMLQKLRKFESSD